MSAPETNDEKTQEWSDRCWAEALTSGMATIRRVAVRGAAFLRVCLTAGEKQGMFDDLDLGLGATLSAAPVAAPVARSAAVAQEVAELEENGFAADLDAMVAAAEQQSLWRGEYEAGDEVEAVWDEDGQW